MTTGETKERITIRNECFLGTEKSDRGFGRGKLFLTYGILDWWENSLKDWEIPVKKAAKVSLAQQAFP